MDTPSERSKMTADLDIWIGASPANARRVWAALAAFGAPLDDLPIRAADLARPDIVAQFGLPPYRIAILTGLSGVSFAEACDERVEELFADLRVSLIGRAALIRNKRASGRTRDLADREALGETAKPGSDWSAGR